LKGRIIDSNGRLLTGGAETLPPEINGVYNFTSECPIIHGEIGTFNLLTNSDTIKTTIDINSNFFPCNVGKTLYYIFSTTNPSINNFNANVTFKIPYLYSCAETVKTVNYQSNRPFMVMLIIQNGPLAILSSIIPIVVPNFGGISDPGSSITIS
jgi:hypothetical protein